MKTPIAVLKAKMLPTPVPNNGGVASEKFVARVCNTACALDDAREGGRRVTECRSLRSSRKPWPVYAFVGSAISYLSMALIREIDWPHRGAIHVQFEDIGSRVMPAHIELPA